jgi:hypothetical protein
MAWFCVAAWATAHLRPGAEDSWVRDSGMLLPVAAVGGGIGALAGRPVAGVVIGVALGILLSLVIW